MDVHSSALAFPIAHCDILELFLVALNLSKKAIPLVCRIQHSPTMVHQLYSLIGMEGVNLYDYFAWQMLCYIYTQLHNPGHQRVTPQ